MFGENSANFSKKTVTLFGKTPSCKKSQSFFILVSPDITDTFPFYKIFAGASFEGSGSGFVLSPSTAFAAPEASPRAPPVSNAPDCPY